MPAKYQIEFISTEKPIREPVTKFGGQPHWISGPEWPVSTTTGKPMCFIGQIALHSDLVGTINGQMAYLFMADDPLAETCDPDAGDNAVIIQPGNCSIKTMQLSSEGPTLQRWTEPSSKERSFLERLFGKRPPRVLQNCEFAVKLTRGEDPVALDENRLLTLPPAEVDEYYTSVRGNKLGGTPEWVQSPEYPFRDPSLLLLQLDSGRVPFHINFGDAGVGYVFLSANGSQAKFLWQCS